MNTVDIIRMADKAGFEIAQDDGWLDEQFILELEAFAKLVAQHTLLNIDLSKFMSYQEGMEAGRLAEREAIAQMIEDAPTLMDFAQNDQGGCLMCGFTPKLAAQTIRARGQA